MLIIAVVRSHKLEQLQCAIAEYNKTDPPTPWALVELERFDIAGIPISRIALVCDTAPPPEFEIPIEQIIQTPNYCPHCLELSKWTALNPNNRSGVCRKHQDRLKSRSKSRKKK